MKHTTEVKVDSGRYLVVVEFDPDSQEPEYFELTESHARAGYPDLPVRTIEEQIVSDFDLVGRIEDEILEKIGDSP